MIRIRLLAATILAGATAYSPATAQTEAKLSQIEAQIRALQSELARVRHELAASKGELRRAQVQPAQPPRMEQAATRREAASAPAAMSATPISSAAPPVPSAPDPNANPGGISFPGGRPTFTSDNHRFSAAAGLQFHYDIAGYFQSHDSVAAQFPRLNTFGENLRRARLPFVFKFDDFEADITPDFGGSPDGSPTLYEANVNYAPKGTPFTATIGYFKPWLTLGDATSSNSFLFLERPSIVEASRNIAAGDARSSAGLRWAANRYFIAAYLTGAPYGSQTAAVAQPQQTSATIRLAGRPVASDDVDLHLGFSASDAFRIQRTSTGQTLTVQDRPELRVDNNRLVSTGALNARSAYTYGPEFAFRYRNFMVQGEYIRIGVDRTNGGAPVPTPGLEFDGGYIEGSWVISGEPRRYNKNLSAFDNPKVAHPLLPGQNGIGAFELVARYSHINLNDKVTRGIAAATTGGVYGGEQNIYAIGLNWYPNDYLRLMLDYDVINVDKLSSSGTTQNGQRVQAVALRTQVAF